MQRQEVKLKIHPVTYVVWVILIITGQTQFLLCSFICAALHEASHVAAYLTYGANVCVVELLPFGISATLGKTELLSCKAEIICAFCGPLMNLFLSAVLLFMSDSVFIGCDYFIYCNLAYFLINILPVIPLDGGRILYFLLLKKTSVRLASMISKTINILTVIAVFAFGAYVLIASKSNVSVLLIGVYLLIYILTSSYRF